MKGIWIALVGSMAVALAPAGCGSSACDEAVDKLEECGQPTGVVTGECDDRSECEADCINAASCDELEEAFSGTPNSYSDCDDACN